ncbi:MAG: glycosyltransferase family 2 protein [Thermoanaerobaculia bacterium]|nr:glycosyltransferase family 2 protein [Thermoanaerobaculia bacterium]
MTARPATTLSIVIPAFNEEARLPVSLEKLARYAAAGGSARIVEVLVVDDGSEDRTGDVAEERGRALGLPLRTLRLEQNSGKGAAVRTGVLAATGTLILVSDADFSTPVEEWERLAAAEAPVAIGSRAIDESLVRKKQPLFRRAMGKLFNRLVQVLAIPGIRDTQCGFKLFTREAGHEIFRRTKIDRFAYDVEALLVARRLGYEIAEIPVLWFNSIETRVSLLGGLQAYADLLRVRLLVARTFRQERRATGGKTAS